MGSSAKKKKEKKQDFQKPKLKVGKARPKNTNATDTSFSAKSIVLKQQNLSESGRNATDLFHHNLSLLSSKNDTQRRDALTNLIAAIAANAGDLPQPTTVILSRVQPLILDGSSSVRQQLVKLFKVLPRADASAFESTLLYILAGMNHLSIDTRATALDVLEWMLETNGEGLVSIAGGWTKTLRNFQRQLGWDGDQSKPTTTSNGTWSTTKSTSNDLGSNKLLVHQLTTLSHLLTAGLKKAQPDPRAAAQQAAALFPLWQTDAHMISTRGDPLGYLNIFGAPRDVENEVYDDADERAEVFKDLAMNASFTEGVKEVKKVGGEVGRAAAAVDKALRLVDST
ncbi:Pre-rRNA-processing protein IPI1 [Fulvia fulva]|uniref:Pre-rRNA-processing protein n=1 Tax=Passalora fulva TaxID=5499 RepID=A0A9Q8L6D1_PASFU|nr:Pre-rRNA-processing protein IPI1 [Fulvia fulva]KAK4635663.1 Pre-rRNA-processing protein IPI1 [Fulvia fulva]KAK4637186.1 Pre-rRNA-processing protein IPI1 [Fulvia fulva]UJO11644.1 Pre-rRNA-processing protein IPI1 [Fulvia fulva]WPV08156.1 Pre-rRNA-processing protein IPI1 [Fulvia fulva]WPV23754.1 Pre-rRNA-processing protein IPI1 [Fulvia fulva]